MEVEDLCLEAEAHTQRPGGSDWLKETANRGENKMQIAKPSRKWLWGGGLFIILVIYFKHFYFAIRKCYFLKAVFL